MPAWLLKLLATLLTGLATVGAAVFVGGHLKNAAAPLHPPVVTAVDTSGSMYVGPAVQPTDEPPMVFSSVS